MKPALLPTELSSFITIDPKGHVTTYFGKIDGGQGLFNAIGQMVAEELDAKFEDVTIEMGDTATSVNQGGMSGSTGVSSGGKQMRAAAAEARRVLLTLAAQKWKVPVERLTVSDGVISGPNGKTVTYGELIGGKFFSTKLEWNKQMGNALYAPGKATLKTPDQFKVIGKPIKRTDVAAKVFAQQDWTADVRVPGMKHARMIRPPVAGAEPVSYDEAALQKQIPGVRVFHDKGFLAVVADKEWDAVRAADALHVTWSDVKPPFVDHDQVYDYLRKTEARTKKVEKDSEKIDEVFKTAARVMEAEYEWPFQSHACMGPGCAVADFKDGQLTIWSGSQKPHSVREGVADHLKMPQDKIHVMWVQGPGSYGRNDAGDVAMDAAVLATALGGAVRVQYSRADGTAWDPKSTPSVHTVRAALDKDNKLVGLTYHSQAFSRLHLSSQESRAQDTLAGQFQGTKMTPNDTFAGPENAYAFANLRTSWGVVAPMLDRASPLRTSHFRDPLGPQITFALESFLDEVAVATKADPIAFRMNLLGKDRDKQVVKATAEKHGWTERVSGPTGKPGKNGVLTGRGFSYAQRGGVIIAVIAEIEVDPATGRIWPRKFTVGHDCGLIINPDNLVKVIEGNIVQSASRTLFEEVTFNAKGVTSVDWNTYRIMDTMDVPETIDVVLVNHPEMPPGGGGEGSTKPVAAALANALFDATGVRVRRAPLSPERVKQALSSTRSA